MRIHNGSILGLAALLAIGCGKKVAPAAGSSSASVEVPKLAESAQPLLAASASAVAAVAAAALPSEVTDTSPPASFTDAEVVKNAVATGLGCEARTKAGWLELLCRKKNGAGGHPKEAVVGVGVDVPPVTPDEQGELHVVIPYRDGAEVGGTIEWTDTKYNLKVKGKELKLEWAVSLDVQRACAKLAKASSEVTSNATKSEQPDHLTAAEASKFPRFGVCQPAGLGSWALGLANVSVIGKDDTRAINFEIEVLHVNATGEVKRASFGTLQTAPGGLEIRPLQIYDYDDDGSVELIVPYDLKALPKGGKPAAIPVVWSVQGEQITPYKNLSPFMGGAQTMHLEFDMRPDIGSYEPFIAYLGADCGAETCPPRLTGPARYYRSLANGEFSRADAQARTALTRACPKGTALVVKGNPTRTANNVACARLQGTDSAKLEADLKAKGADLCKGTDSCPLLDTLIQFANTKVED